LERVAVSAPVLAAFDPVALDPAPVRFAAMVAAVTGAPLHIAAVYADDDVVDRLTGGQLGEDLTATPGRAVDRIVAELRREGAAAEALLLGATSPPRALSLAAEQLGAGLVVVGSAARAEPGVATAGSTGERLFNGCPCAVAVVPLEWVANHAMTVIGTGFVDTAEGREAVHGAHALADRAGTVLRVIVAVHPPSWMLPDGDGADDPRARTAAYEAVGAEIRERAEQAAQAGTGGLLGAPVDIDVLVADPAELLLAASREVDLLVCGSRGYGPTPATLVGGVTRRLVTGAGCPVVVTPHGPEIALQALVAQE
jgi:nucleotide-binding universal stress UspA family protein